MKLLISFTFSWVLLAKKLHKCDAEEARERLLQDSGNNSTSPAEVSALHDLYMATGGTNWEWVGNGTQWNFTTTCNPCGDQWEGVKCAALDTSGYAHIAKLSLPGHNLRGSLPTSLINLTRLVELNLIDNSINGTIPAIFGSAFPEMESMILSFNDLTGSLPSKLGLLPRLHTLAVDSNRLQGPIPVALANLTTLEVLSLADNRLTSTIPAALGNLTELTIMLLFTNQLTGTIPPSLASLTKLVTLSLYDNHIQGTIPAYLCTFPDLKYVNLYNNRLQGTLPECIGHIPKLTFLTLYGNEFTGTIPASYATLPLLEQLWLQENDLQGSLPQLWSAPQLQQLILFETFVTGTLPESLGTMKQLIYLYLPQNFLTGTIPVSVGNMAGLQFLHLEDNLLSGTVPTSLSQLSMVNEVYLANNSLSGGIDGVFNATAQRVLLIVDISNNQLTGTLPTQAFLPPQLNTFVAVSNCFTGTLPEGMCQNKALVSLILDGLQTAPHCRERLTQGISNAYIVPNKFNGIIPPCLFEMSNLTSLHLSGNGLTGSLPENFPISKSLIDFTASHNALTGTLPDTFQQHVWKNLDVSFNRLTGELWTDFAALPPPHFIQVGGKTYDITNVSYGSTFALQNNRLSGFVPHALVHAHNVSLLGSNMFSCEIDKGDLPQHDQQHSNYQCGSDAFDRPFYLWLVVLGLGAAVVVCALRVAWFQRNAVIQQALNCIRKWSPDAECSGRNFQYVSDVSDILCRIGAFCTAATVIVLVPWYTAASYYYGTYTHQYGWVVSAAFLSGNSTAAAQLVFYMLLQAFLVAALAYGLVTYDRQGRHQSRSRHNTVSRDGRYVFVEEEVAHFAHRTAVYVAFLSINSIVVGGANLAFVLVALYRSASEQIIAQVLLSLFKLVWNSVATPFFIRRLSSYVSNNALTTGFVTVHAFTALFNNIVIPCLVVAVVSPSCFYNVFDAAPPVTSVFIYLSCVWHEGNNECGAYQPVVLDTSYDPPFRYSYQCSSSFITYYAPAFIYLAIAASFVVPLLKVALQQLHKRSTPGTHWHQALDLVLPRILKPIIIVLSDGSIAGSHNGSVGQAATERRSSDSAATIQSVQSDQSRASTRSAISYDDLRRDKFDPFFDANIYIISLIMYLGILLTFGVVFPPLAVAMCVTMLSVAWQGRLAVGRFLHNARELNASKFVDIIEQECKGAVTIPKIRRCIFIIICFSCCFYALFLYDTLGNAEGQSHAYWVLIVLPLFPLCVFVVIVVRARLQGDFLRGLKESPAEVEMEENGMGAPSALSLPELKRGGGGSAVQRAGAAVETFNVLQA